MKKYQITYLMGEIIDTIEANSKEEAEDIANERIGSELCPTKDAYCYKIEVELSE